MLWVLLAVFALIIYALVISALWWLQKKQNMAHEALQNFRPPRELPKSTYTRDPIEQKADEAQSLQQTFQKFVPRQFVDHFAMGGAESLKLGFASEDEVAVMFCDIRGFTGLSEQMTPQQLMNFLNSYFLRMNAPIHDNFGFIDKFIGDAIMALFDHPDGESMHKASDAIQAALGLQKALVLYNHHRAKSGYKSIKNGIGLHYGPVILGTVGSDDRMDTTVIGDTVNIAQRIESLTTYFDVDILASEDLVNHAAKHLPIAHRLVDYVVLKGKTNTIALVEIYQHLDNDAAEQRNATIDIIKEGIKLRSAREFEKALVLFQKSSDLYPHDKVLQHHLHWCEKLSKEPEWDGLIHF